jgi:hypothetical protein
MSPDPKPDPGAQDARRVMTEYVSAAELERQNTLKRPRTARAASGNGSDGLDAKRTDDLGIAASDLQHMRFPEIKYVVPGYVVEGLTLFAGKPKLGKSWLMLHIAIAVARGGQTLGDIQCVQGDVLYCALEDNGRRLQRRMVKLLPASQPWPHRLQFITEMPRLKDGGIETVRRWIKSGESPRLIVIDTLARVRDPKGHDKSDYEADYAAVSELKTLADKHGIAIVLVHHQRKMEAEDPIDTVSGTTGLTGAVDSVLVLYHKAQGTVLYGRGRDIEEIEKAVTFDKQFCVWRVDGEAREVHRSDARTKIVTALCDSPEPMSPREVADETALPYANVRQLLVRMHKAGEVERAKRGCYAFPKPAVTTVTSSQSRSAGE